MVKASFDEKLEPIVVTRRAEKTGPTIAIFAAVHGNETVGVLAINKAIKEIVPLKGVIHFAIANPRAVASKKRFVEKNLNRCFVKNNSGVTYEDKLALKLMKVLDESDALLDLHGYNGKEDQPFLICEPESFEVARKLNFEVISSGWAKAEPGGTDGYMHSLNKIAICAETGSNFYPQKYFGLAYKTILQFLKYFGAIESSVEYSKKSKKYIQVEESIIRENEQLSFNKNYQNFDSLADGEIFIRDGAKEYTAVEGQYIIFPRPNAEIGQEVCVIGRKLKI